MEYYIFLKGANVGRNAKVDMPAVKNELAHVGLENVASYLNSEKSILSSNIAENEIASVVNKVIFSILELI